MRDETGTTIVCKNVLEIVSTHHLYLFYLFSLSSLNNVDRTNFLEHRNSNFQHWYGGGGKNSLFISEKYRKLSIFKKFLHTIVVTQVKTVVWKWLLLDVLKFFFLLSQTNMLEYLFNNNHFITIAEKDINEVWEYVAKKNRVNERHIERLKSTHSICPVLYLLTKTHKFPNNIPVSDPQSIKVKPIISGCGGPADKVSWLIHKICTPLLQYVKAHLKNTGQLINNLRKFQNGELKNKFLFSLDVVSLYPSVNNDAAIDTLRMYLEKEKISSCSNSLFPT